MLLKSTTKKLALVALAGLATACTGSYVKDNKTFSEDGEVLVSASKEAVTKAVMNPARGDAAMRDMYRNPQQTLEFFGIRPDMTVVEILPGGGWYTSILNPIVKDQGKFYAAHFHMYDGAPGYYQRSLESFKNKVETNELYQGLEITEFHHTKAHNIAPEGTADMVLTFRNVHNWYMADGDEGVEQAFVAFAKALKPGGVLGVVEHRLPEDRDQAENKRSGYMKESYVIAAAEKAGFKLQGKSDINANPKDTADHPRGVWTLPPRLALGDQDKAKYAAIGESDRMTLKFVKQ